MIIYNVTINVEEDVHEEWLQWMKKSHIPDVLASGIFFESRILKILGDDESGGHTYSIQYTCRSLEDFHKYEELFAPALRAEFNERYKDRVLSFRTLLETID
jgi:hypothetical protein